ncbi:MAG: hypothetical protein AAGB34_04640 [Planctomycetota bacterium]
MTVSPPAFAGNKSENATNATTGSIARLAGFGLSDTGDEPAIPAAQ